MASRDDRGRDDDDGPRDLGVPQDAEAEDQVIGGLLLDDQAIGQVAGRLRTEDFFSAPHRTVYAVMLTLHDRGQPTDLSLVRAELEQRKQLDDLGGYSTLVRWLTNTPSVTNLLHYASVVADRALRRRLLTAVGKIAELAYEAATGEAAAEKATEVLAQAAASSAVGQIVDLSTLVDQVWDDTRRVTDARQEGEVVDPGLTTGFPDLDRTAGGMRPGELLLLAARPSVGKTSLAAQIALTVASRGQRVLVFSLEMAGKEVAARILWQQAKLDGQVAVRGLLDEAGLETLSRTAGVVSEHPIRIDDTPSLPVSMLVARARGERLERGLGLIVVDYLQLLRGTPRRDGNRVAEVTEISQLLKGLARDLNVPVLALSQLNRQVEARGDRRPGLSDLRDSGSLEQDADQVWLLWRDDPNGPPVVNLTVAKNRNGPTGTCSLRWGARTTRFDPFSGREE